MAVTKSKPVRAGHGGSLRELKKERTRAAIQAAGLRLFAEQGYDATTCEQIAAAAEVSPATFFRYFATKEDVVLTDEYGPLRLQFLAGHARGERPFRAIREAVAAAWEAIWPRDAEAISERVGLLLSVPQLRSRIFDLQREAESVAASQVATLVGEEPNSLRVRVITAAVAGAMLAATEYWVANGGELPALIDEALAVLEEPGREG